MKALFPAIAALLFAAPALAAPASADVTRFHTGGAIAPDSIAIVPGPDVPADSLEFRTHADVVAAELAKMGFAGSQTPAYRAVMTIDQQQGPPKRSPFSVGIGGSTGGWNGGVGGGVSFPLGGRGARVMTTLSLQMRRVADNIMVWEGRATADLGKDGLSKGLPVLARALFTGFPGPSGQTVKVKTPR
ncbi:DUF4136 domain-containing protein [Sandarakinorhabdus sp.]|uniref:DUF4136 domain-containing protein n=1 Tax=Sandarakinorhabdus sp. TaxID=1916663 RepID=UPI00286E020C|nr:DUF4136 domain-containing protein [Sandarakinorhabdus sp.]